jgi:hypothetical protein
MANEMKSSLFKDRLLSHYTWNSGLKIASFDDPPPRKLKIGVKMIGDVNGVRLRTDFIERRRLGWLRRSGPEGDRFFHHTTNYVNNINL